jgi:hypothetical protein
MRLSPQFVIERKQSKRLVTDHTASGLNDGISREDAKVRYDTLLDLGRIMRFHHARYPKPRLQGTLWKSDVKGAFRNLPMHPAWQIVQVIRVERPESANAPRVAYHVDHRAVFGNRRSPDLWCTFFALVGWACRRHMGVATPTFFVDDQFGYDTSNIRGDLRHEGVTRLLPRDQFLTLRMWQYLGIPFSWEKQLEGTRIPILGMDVDASNMSITLNDEAKEDLQDTIDQFLARDRPVLSEWWRLLGHLNWALPLVPLARPALSSAYAKIRGKCERVARVSTLGCPECEPELMRLSTVYLRSLWKPFYSIYFPLLLFSTSLL